MEGVSASLKESEKKLRSRFMGKFFKDKKENDPSNDDTQHEVDEFLHGPPSDKLHMVGTSPSFPQPPTRIDSATAPRWPTTSDPQWSRGARHRSASPRQSRKGLAVHFTSDQPEIIGEGGDEATSPVAEIGMRRRANTHPPVLLSSPEEPSTEWRRDAQVSDYGSSFAERVGNMDSFRPGPFPRTQTDLASMPILQPAPEPVDEARGDAQDDYSKDLSNRTTRDRRVFADMVKAEMKSEKDRALLQARGSPDELFMGSETAGESAPTPQTAELHIKTMKNPDKPPSLKTAPSITSSRPSSFRAQTPSSERAPNHLGESPAGETRAPKMSIPLSLQPSIPVTGNDMAEGPANLSRTSTLSYQDAAIAVGDDALQEFSRRTTHLHTLFRLSTEATKPLSQCSLEELVRVALWWFLKGRMNLESALRDRPNTPQAQQANYFMRAQSYADLAKSLWLTETVTSTYPETQMYVSVSLLPERVFEI